MAAHDEIRKAFLRLAKRNHPDLHPGDKDAETRFKQIASAYDIIGDKAKRARFDAGEIDASGVEVPPRPERGFYHQRAEADPDSRYEQHWSGTGDGFDGDPFAELFRARTGRRTARGSDVHYTLAVEFLEAANGTKKRVVMADGKTLDITIPAGLNDGQTLRLRGQGQPGAGGAAAGDVLVEVHINGNAVFLRDGTTIRSTLAVTVAEALAGAKLQVATISGTVSLLIPKGSNTGTVLRLRGKGISTKAAKGDHLVTLEVMLPSHADDDFIGAVVEWEAKNPYNPRKEHGAHS